MNTYVVNVSSAWDEMVHLVENDINLIGKFMNNELLYDDFFHTCADTAFAGLDTTNTSSMVRDEAVRFLTGFGLSSDDAVGIVVRVGDLITNAVRRQFPEVQFPDRSRIRVNHVTFKMMTITG